MEIIEAISHLKSIVKVYNEEVEKFNKEVDEHNERITKKIYELVNVTQDILSPEILQLNRDKLNRASLIKLFPFELNNITYSTEEEFKKDTNRLFKTNYRVSKRKRLILKSMKSAGNDTTFLILDNDIVKLYTFVVSIPALKKKWNKAICNIMPMISLNQLDERIVKRVANRIQEENFIEASKANLPHS